MKKLVLFFVILGVWTGYIITITLNSIGELSESSILEWYEALVVIGMLLFCFWLGFEFNNNYRKIKELIAEGKDE